MDILLYEYIKCGDLEKIKDQQLTDSEKKIAFNQACACGNLDIVKYFYDQGIMDEKSHLTAARNGRVNVFSYLIDKGVRCDDPDMIFDYAVLSGKIEMLTYLDKLDINISNSKISNKWIPALINYSIEMIEYLLTNGVDIRDCNMYILRNVITNCNRHTLLAFFKIGKIRSLFETDKKNEIVSLLYALDPIHGRSKNEEIKETLKNSIGEMIKQAVKYHIKNIDKDLVKQAIGEIIDEI